jgi:hypothetical protein
MLRRAETQQEVSGMESGKAIRPLEQKGETMVEVLIKAAPDGSHFGQPTGRTDQGM